MTTTEQTAGEYVSRRLPRQRVGTYTGVPATGIGSCVSGVGTTPTGCYTRSDRSRERDRSRAVAAPAGG